MTNAIMNFEQHARKWVKHACETNLQQHVRIAWANKLWLSCV